MAIRIVQDNSELSLIFDRQRLSRGQLESLQQQLRGVDGVISVKIQNLWLLSQKVTVTFGSETAPSVILRRMADGLRAHNDEPVTIPVRRYFDPLKALRRPTRRPLAPNGALATEKTARPTTSGPWTHFKQIVREFVFGVLAVGAFGMAWIGLLLPGIPTVPFVLLTAYFALKASPSLRARLLRSRMFGPMMRDWQKYGAIRRDVKLRAYLFTAILIVISFAIAPPVPALYALMVLMATIGLYIIARLPVIQSDDEADWESTAPKGNVAPSVA